MCIYNMEEIQLDTLGQGQYTDYCEVVSSDEESSDEDRFLEFTVSTSDEYSATRRFVSLDVDIPITEEQMNELRNATSSTGIDDYESEDETFTPEVMDYMRGYVDYLQTREPTRVVMLPRPMPYYLPLKTIEQYEVINAREQSNGKGYNRTFIG
jgi:hypothetical protein